MRKSGVLSLVLWAVTAAGGSLAQTPISYSQSGQVIFSVEMPDFWVARSGGPRVFEDPELGALEIQRIIALQPETNDSAWVGLASPIGISSLDDGQAYITNIGEFLVENPSVGATFDTRFGGLPSRVINGQGTRDGRAVRYSVVIADLPGDRVALLVGLATPDAEAGIVDEINAIFRSLKVGG